MLKAVVDTNVWVSGLLARNGQPARIIDLFRTRFFNVCCSTATVEELQDVLARPRIAARIPQTEAEQLIHLLKARAIFVVIEALPTICRDPKDNVFLACATAGGADVIVTGDQDLLVLQT